MLDALSDADVDWGSIIAVSSIGGLVYGVNKLIEVASKFASPFEAIASDRRTCRYRSECF